MEMKMSYALLSLLGISAVLAFFVVLIYMAFYKHYLSERVKVGIKNSVGNKKLIEPVKVFFICFIIFCILSGFFVSFKEPYPNTQKNDTILEKCNESILDDLSCENDISGYTRKEENIGGIRCVCYVSKKRNDMFPDLLIYIDSDGEYTLKYRISDNSDISVPNHTIASENAEWYAVSNIADGAMLVIGSDDDTVSIKL